MTELGFTFPGGQLNQDVTSVALTNNTAKTIDTEVPAGKKWIALSVKITNPDDVQRNVAIRKYKEAAKTNKVKDYLNTSALAAAAEIMVPSIMNQGGSRNAAWQAPEILVAANTIEVSWAAGGASSGGTDADGLVVEYLEVPAE